MSAELNIPIEAVTLAAEQIRAVAASCCQEAALAANVAGSTEDWLAEAEAALRVAAPLIVAANPGPPLALMPDVDQHVADARTALDEATAAAGLSREEWLVGVAKAHEQLARAYDLVVERLRLMPESAVFDMAVSARQHHYSQAAELRHKAM